MIFDDQGNRIGGARLLAVVTLKDGKAGRQYRVATHRDDEASRKAQKAVEKLATQKLPNGLNAHSGRANTCGRRLGGWARLFGSEV